jgi:hypothetical protein
MNYTNTKENFGIELDVKSTKVFGILTVDVEQES